MAKKQDRYLQKRGNTYYFRKKHKGKIIKRSLNTSDKQTARGLRNYYLGNLLEYGQLDAPKDERALVTFGEVAKEWAAIHKTEVRHSTWRDYVSSMNGHILPRFKDVPISAISFIDVKKFRSQLKVGAKRANNIMVPMKSVFDFAHTEGIIDDNVMRKMKRLTEEDSEIHPFSLDEVNRILDAVHPWYRPYLTVAFFTGMRAGELNGLSWSDFLLDMQPEPHIFIHTTYVYKKDSVPKTKKSKRYIKCLPQVLDALAEQRKLTGNKKHIFLTVDGLRMTPDHIRKEVWMPALEKAGLDYRPPLQTRHTFATMMLSAGEDVGWVQNMLGHSSLQMIFQRYYAWIPRHTRSDGQAFMRFVEGETSGDPEGGQRAGQEKEKSGQGCTNIVPLAEYRRKKRA
jgi:integrase